MRTLLLLLLITLGPIALTQVAPDKYFVAFTDKNGTPYSIQNPSAFLSQRSIARRAMQGIPVVESDLPVNPSYIQQVKSFGVLILNPTKWLNGVTIQVADTSVMASIRALPFVAKVYKSTGSNNITPVPVDKFSISSTILPVRDVTPMKSQNSTQSYDYGISYKQINLVKGDALHNAGLRGEGMIIAVLDAGFLNVDWLPAFDSLRSNGQILGTRDFVIHGNNVYNEYFHGMSVLSIMGGNVPGMLVGTAPKAKYWLLRSEDVNTEYIIEEYNWVSAAEFADSAGADVINSSLGYQTFNEPKYDHTCADMDGNTTPVTRGANMAAGKGIAVVNSAGNSGGSGWTCVGAPSDGHQVMAIAAVDSNGIRASFSSVGVNSGGRVKPNVAAMGEQTVVANWDGSIGRGNGTSYSSPVIAGLITCLWQSHPEATVPQLYLAMQRSSSQYNAPDSLLGYGLPNFENAMAVLSSPTKDLQPKARIYPNPAAEMAVVEYPGQENEEIVLTLMDQSGRTLSERRFHVVAGINRQVIPLSGYAAGIYLITLRSPSGVQNLKLMVR